MAGSIVQGTDCLILLRGEVRASAASISFLFLFDCSRASVPFQSTYRVVFLSKTSVSSNGNDRPGDSSGLIDIYLNDPVSQGSYLR